MFCSSFLKAFAGVTAEETGRNHRTVCKKCAARRALYRSRAQ